MQSRERESIDLGRCVMRRDDFRSVRNIYSVKPAEGMESWMRNR